MRSARTGASPRRLRGWRCGLCPDPRRPRSNWRRPASTRGPSRTRRRRWWRPPGRLADKGDRGVGAPGGEGQSSRGYAVLARGEAALVHALRSLEICQAHGIGDFDLAYAYEALARAWATLGSAEETSRYLALARETGARIKEVGEQEML